MHVRYARDFNNIEIRAVIKFCFLQSKAPKEIHAILTETLTCFLPGRAKDLSAPLYVWSAVTLTFTDCGIYHRSTINQLNISQCTVERQNSYYCLNEPDSMLYGRSVKVNYYANEVNSPQLTMHIIITWQHKGM